MLIREQAGNGIDSVPYVVLEGKRRDFTIEGAREVEEYVKELEKVAKECKWGCRSFFLSSKRHGLASLEFCVRLEYWRGWELQRKVICFNVTVVVNVWRGAESCSSFLKRTHTTPLRKLWWDFAFASSTLCFCSFGVQYSWIMRHPPHKHLLPILL